MNRWLLVLGAAVLVLVVGLYWQMTRDANETKTPTATTDTTKEPVTKPTQVSSVKPPRRDARSAPEVAKSEGDAPPKYKFNTDEFDHRIDVVIPDKFRAVGAFNCDESGVDPDGKVRVTYKIRIRNGRVSATNIKALGERGAEKLARCIEDSLQNADFPMPRMPDFEEDTELFIRAKSLQKYRSRKEFDE